MIVMNLPGYVRLILGLGAGVLAAHFFIVEEAEALSCVDPESVTLEFTSATPLTDEAFWRREFSPLEDPALYDSRTLTNNSLSSHDGWWRLEHKGSP